MYRWETIACQQAGVAAPQGTDHSMLVAPPPGAVLTERVDRGFDRYALPVAPFGGPRAATEAVVGHVVWTAHRLPGANLTVFRLIEDYRSRLLAAGFADRFACATEDCGGFAFRFGVALLPPPAMQMDVRDFAQLTLLCPALRSRAPDGTCEFADSVQCGRPWPRVRLAQLVEHRNFK